MALTVVTVVIALLRVAVFSERVLLVIRVFTARIGALSVAIGVGLRCALSGRDFEDGQWLVFTLPLRVLLGGVLGGLLIIILQEQVVSAVRVKTLLSSG